MRRASNPITRPIRRLAVLAAMSFSVMSFALIAAGQPMARDDDTWPVHGRLLGKDDKKSGDVSGIACAKSRGLPRPCLVIDDNVQFAQFVTVKEGELIAGETIALIDNSFDGKYLELDGEGVAYADGFYYVMGSHGHPRDSRHDHDREKDAAKIAARIAASSQIVRFRSDGDRATSAVERTGKLRAIIAQEPALASFVDRRLEDNGLTIEGIAVRRGRILAGFRGPMLSNGRAAVLSVAVDGVFGNASPGARLHRLPLGDGRGVRDLAAFGDGVLVLAGPTASDPGPYAIYWWDGESDEVRLLKDLADIVGADGARKAEGLLALDENASGLRVLILFDSKKEGAPIAIVIPRP
jgi:Protein of unknown function (DUF3616)